MCNFTATTFNSYMQIIRKNLPVLRNGGRKFKGMRCDVPEDNRPNLAPISVKNLPPTSSFPFCFVSSNCSCHHPDPAVIGLFRTKVHGEFPPEIRIPVLCQYTIRIIFYDGETFVLLCRVLFSTADGSCDIYKCCVDIAVLSPSVIISEKLHLPHIFHTLQALHTGTLMACVRGSMC